VLIPTFDKGPNSRRNPTNMKKLRRENSKANPTGWNGKNDGQEAH